MAHGDPATNHGNWPRDDFGRREAVAQAWFIWSGILLLILLAGFYFWFRNVSNRNEVVAYCAQDQVYAEPIFHEFEAATGLKVLAVYDSEAVKTVGLANRLLAERSHPQCDVFWGNEEMRTRQLAAEKVFAETNGLAAFGYRSRRLVINTNQLSLASAPRSLLDLTNAEWQGKIALAYPQFGTTGTHFHSLKQHWGAVLWEAWCRGLAANKPFLLDGNSLVVKFVGQGEACVGLTDSDDIAAGQREGLPVLALPMNEETLLIPNTVAVTRNGPHPASATRLFDYVQQRQVAATLLSNSALEGAAASEVTAPTLQVNWEAMLRDLDSTTETLNEIFLR
jgi:iron(III) transport system substrate-binding protein